MRNLSVALLLLVAFIVSATFAEAQNMRINGANFRLGTAAALKCYFDEKLYDANSGEAPGIVAKSLVGDGKKLAFRTCRDAEGNTHYFVREPRPNRNGICRVFENEIFPGTSEDEHVAAVLYDGTAEGWVVGMRGWRSWPPEAWMVLHYERVRAELALVTDGQCPKGIDPRYIRVINVTEGLLKQFFTAWKAATASHEDIVRTFGANARSERMWQALQGGKAQFKDITCGDDGCNADSTDLPYVLFDAGPKGIQFLEGPEIISIP